MMLITIPLGILLFIVYNKVFDVTYIGCGSILTLLGWCIGGGYILYMLFTSGGWILAGIITLILLLIAFKK